jgi:hypothetical protein
MTEPSFDYLKLNSRLYQYIRATAITNLDDGLVELITNCVDAYFGIENNPNKISIKISKENKTVEVIDQALGLTAERMRECFFEVGTYMSDENRRGHFSRGAKDIMAIGDCLFVPIKDGKYSCCKLLFDGRGAILEEDVDVTQEIRDMTGIINNGLYVKIDVKQNDFLERFDIDEFEYHYALRDILSNPKYEITYYDLDTNTNRVLSYSLPENNELVIDGEYMVPYYNVPATFQCYITENKTIKYSNNFRFSENGFLISSNNAIYENGMLHNRLIANNPHSVEIYGRIHCDYINTLLKNYETEGPTERNPFPIIDSSRLVGLNRDHPFVKHLFRLPTERIIFILSELQYKSRKNENNDKLNTLFDNLDELQLLSDNIFNLLNIKLITDFKLIKKKVFKPPVVQKFYRENETLRFSKKSIRNLYDEYVEQPSAKLSLNIVDREIVGKYEAFATNQGITINIPSTNSVLTRYISSEDSLVNDTRVKIALADIITESFADILANNELSQSDTENLSQAQIIELFNKTFNKYYNMHEKLVYDLIIG